ncbi:hypothetical protein VHEMI06056 [[Torrubiella] hemipterigena]|uniref:Uncharacterized protein n=1 Tax=[Torrubiella] hemipterigena TaxID=1531966 RepID=A0A0A1SZL7_9HYPO|nr:hypothetical protein VHEMI06056 [[Torrubiella] hemipterigena]
MTERMRFRDGNWSRSAFENGWPWVTEAFFIVLSIAALIAMIALLKVYDGQPVFQWHSVTLNAVIAVLSVVLKACLSSVVGSCLGQWKWILFSREKRIMLDFEKIDLASRGAWGAFSVMLRRPMSNIARLGAFVMLFAVAIDPFSQQLLQSITLLVFETPHESIENAYGRAYTAGTWTFTNQTAKLPGIEKPFYKISPLVDIEMETAILDSLFSDPSLIQRRLQVSCPSGNCKWNKFTTLGVCHRCTNLTSQLKRYDNWARLDNMYNYSAYMLPNGAYLANSENNLSLHPPNLLLPGGSGSGAATSMMGFGTGNASQTVAMGDIKTLIWAMTAVHVNLSRNISTESYHPLETWPNLPIVANECALYYCAKDIVSTMVNTTMEESYTEQTDFARDPASFRPKYVSQEGILSEAELQSLEFDPVVSNIRRSYLQLKSPKNTSIILSIEDLSVASISGYFQQTFRSDANVSTVRNGEGITLALKSSDIPQGKANIAFYATDSLPSKGAGLWNNKKPILETNFALLAKSMTNAIRNDGARGGATQLYGPRNTSGYIGLYKPIYSVQWGWIALHVTLITGGTVFFIITVKHSSLAERTLQCLAWKNNSLAIISKASELGPFFKSTDDVKELNRKAKAASATFNQKEGRSLETAMHDSS